MNVLAKSTLLEFGEAYPEALEALLAWFDLAKRAEFTSFAEVQAVFTAASWVAPDYIVFNIKGNHFRLITTVDFTYRKFRVKEFMRHKDYDRWRPTL
jgi:mRNA interferase HigB